MSRRNSKHWLLGATILTACAPSQIDLGSYVAFESPQAGAVESTQLVKESHEVVWARLVARLSASSFFITQIDRDSHLITVEFAAPMPGEYLDCGTARGAYVAEGETTQTEVMLADGGHIQWGVKTRKHTGVEIEERGDLSYRAHLNGGANIHAAPDLSGGTRVMANARYVLGIEHAGPGSDAGGPPAGLRNAYVFTTHGKEAYETSNTAVQMLQCTSTGVLENMILEMAAAGPG
ncbi:MAG: hypothetical protein ACR2QM_01235 [Longimicrobiales bacterium]